jgi:hypothetical protein
MIKNAVFVAVLVTAIAAGCGGPETGLDHDSTQSAPGSKPKPGDVEVVQRAYHLLPAGAAQPCDGNFWEPLPGQLRLADDGGNCWQITCSGHGVGDPVPKGSPWTPGVHVVDFRQHTSQGWNWNDRALRMGIGYGTKVYVYRDINLNTSNGFGYQDWTYGVVERSAADWGCTYNPTSDRCWSSLACGTFF